MTKDTKRTLKLTSPWLQKRKNQTEFGYFVLPFYGYITNTGIYNKVFWKPEIDNKKNVILYNRSVG